MNISECRYICIKNSKRFKKGKLYWLFPTNVITLDNEYSYVTHKGYLLTSEYKEEYFIKDHTLDTSITYYQ